MSKKLILLMLVGLLLLGCETKHVNTNIFENPACQPPCWENITPGITSKEEALAILSRPEIVDQPFHHQNESAIGFDDRVNFSIHKGKKDYASGSLYILGDRVSIISLGSNYGISLEHAIKLFGAPKSVFAIQTSYYDLVTFLNPEKGINFSYSLTGSRNFDNSPISAETEITSVDFFDPNQYQKLLNSGLIEGELDPTLLNNRLFPWKGYGNAGQYQFPIPPNSSDFSHSGNNVLDFRTNVNLKDVLAFYRNIYSAQGFKECVGGSSVTETHFYLVFNGYTGTNGNAPLVIDGSTISTDQSITKVEIGYMDPGLLHC